jgi:hypothetical protein
MNMAITMITRTERLSPMNRMRIPRLPIHELLSRCLAASAQLDKPGSRPALSDNTTGKLPNTAEA